ncbi:hypothetical protein ARTHROSP310_35090 [Arthrobacter sp. AD-310]
MGKLVVESIGIADLLDRLRSNTWLIPSFQRDFVWSEADVTSLVLSVIEARPIGMATLWEQPQDGGLTLVPASLSDSQNGSSKMVSLANDEKARPNKYYAVLDGRQRSTALAMAFGGLRASDSRRKFSGRYFLDVTQSDVSERVRYIREPQVKANKYDQLSVCVGAGLFPLASDQHDGLMGQWMSYLQEIKNPSNYADGLLPNDDELEQRNSILKQAFEGINETVLAVYIVPPDYNLGEICEIFETLNTTGTKVSTVDLLHSWLNSDTSKEEDPILLRDWIDDLGQLEGAFGWASRTNRPEIIAQTATACYLVMDDAGKPAPRQVGGAKTQMRIAALKASDLLATPTEFWKNIVAESSTLASYIGDFQKCVSGAYFPLSECPYPVTMAMYCALRWYMDHDSRYSQQWSEDELNALYRAFFWRNSLNGRYDQGFLSQSAADLKTLKEILFRRAKAPTANAWASEANDQLSRSVGPAPTFEDIYQRALQAKPAGALGRALSLPVRTMPTTDLLEPGTQISYPSAKPVELHHIYPRAWCANNQHGALGEVLDPNRAEFDYVRSVANMTPLTRESNNSWRAMVPGQALANVEVEYAVAKKRLDSHFVSENGFRILTDEEPNPKAFWEDRATLIATDLVSRCSVSL